MLHPSYTDLMEVVNSEVEQGEAPVVNSRYSIVLATAKRARQIIDGSEPLVGGFGNKSKPLSIAIAELHEGETRILSEDAEEIMESEDIMVSEDSDEVVAAEETNE